MSATFAYLALGLFAAALVWAAAGDARRLLIPNRIVIGILALYPIFVFSAPIEIAWLEALGLGFAAFALGALLFACGCAGGGDVKLIAATTVWAGPDLIAQFLIVTAFAGGIVAVAVSRPVRALVRRLTPVVEGDALALPAVKSGPVPYGIAIACGGLFVATRLVALLSA